MFNRLTAATLASALLLSGCGAWQTVSDASVGAYHAVFYKQVKVLNIDLSARASINPDEAKRPCSVAVRVYQLKDRKLFDGASYADLLKNDKTVLGQDLQASVATVVNPGGSASLSQPMQADTEYVAVVAFYRDVSGTPAWRRVVTKKVLSPDAPLRVELVDTDVMIAGDAPKERPAQ
ncbi:type VI secretion system lipoprotein TssJ [Ralstonia sp. 25C]|uniref:type VI secretion system lipoprotein TssJ n=1 Tax=Ralstonia sp. 25C TaxID=3447363 RepID=UPI003F74EAC3